MAIRTFACGDTEAVFNGDPCPRFQNIRRQLERKLTMLDNAQAIIDLAAPGNHLEKLKGDRSGSWSIRVNDQYRLCFTWGERDAFDVECTDYH